MSERKGSEDRNTEIRRMPRSRTPEPAKSDRPMIYNDDERFQSGATLRNRYEQGHHLPPDAERRHD